ncbi:natriuretic peptide Na-NP-like [Astyanax mexicanus]|uniref:Natriuretic peptide Na-NP-like n=1 Tax=Astyanax mexicanus TaxID=7994 RepID=A0A8T2LY89_ASTMX|nr:natriuretic peptide Na-NP-like [Astyanax mexicanus]
MEIPHLLICGVLMLSLFLVPSGESVPVVKEKVPAANVTVTVATLRANVTGVVQEAESRGRSSTPVRKKPTNKQTNKQTNKREKRKNCFGFKMDRISDLSGMGCKKAEVAPPGN